jgi:HEAT repeat protein
MSLWNKILLSVIGALVVALLAIPTAPAADEATSGDEQVLRGANVSTEPAGLVAYLRKHVLSDAERQKIEALIAQLGSERFEMREEASEKLVAIRGPAVSFLRAAVRSSNLEVSHRAEVCLSEIEAPPDGGVASSVVRLLARKPNGDALQALLDYFPFAADDGTEEEVLNALGILGVRAGKPDPLLMTALKDPLPAKRAAAACVLARLGDAEHRAAVRQMLGDTSLRVRHAVGRGLLGDRFPKLETPLSIEDKQFVKTGHIVSDGPGLIAFFKKRTLSDDDRKNIEKMVRQLDDNQFAARQEASQKLEEIGVPALPFLERALEKGPSLEMTRRIEECQKKIKQGPGPALPQAAARLLAQRQPPEAIQVLLDYIPFADDSSVEDEVLATLAILSVQTPKLPAPLITYLKDPLPPRRAAAALVVGQVGEKEQCDTLHELLKDDDRRVRLRSAQGLVAVKDKAGVPALVALLADAPPVVAGLAETSLQQIAGDKAPPLSVAEGGDEGRKKAHEAWATWWRDSGDKLVLGTSDVGQAYLGLTIVCELPGNANRVWEFGADGKERWSFNDANTPTDVRWLGGNKVLVAENSGRKVTERDLKGKILWQKDMGVNMPVSAQRLANGNTFIAHYNGVMEVTPQGKELYAHNGLSRNRGNIYDAIKLPNGHFAFICWTGQVVEMDTAGKEIRKTQVGQNLNWGGLDLLPGGRLLVAVPNPGKVMELDPRGKVAWEVDAPGASHAVKLPNGNVLAACMNNQRYIEVSRGNKIVWEKPTTGRPFHIRRR